MMRTDALAVIVIIVSIILLIVSAVLIVDRGIPALNNVSVPVTVAPRAASAPTIQMVTLPPPTSSQPSFTDVISPTPPMLVTATPAVSGSGIAPAPIVCASPISGADRVLFDGGNTTLGNTNAHRFNVDATFTLNVGGVEGSLALSAPGFGQARLDGSVELQAEVNGTLTWTPVPDQPAQTAQFQVPFRFDSQFIYFRLVVPSRAVDTPWFKISFENLLNAATGNSFMGGLPVGVTIEPGATVDGSLLGLDIGALEEDAGFLSLFDFGRFVCTERLAGNSGEAHYTSSIDLLSFLQSSDFADVVDSLMAMMGGAPGTGQMLAAQMPMLIQGFVTEMNIRIDHYINITDNNISRVTLDIDTGFRLPDTNNVVPLEFDITGSIRYSDYGTRQTLDLPPSPIEIQSIDEISAYLPSS
jgi:hypothetical protein